MIEKKDLIFFVNDVKVQKICKIYDYEVEKLLNNLKNISKIEEIRSLFMDFINSFTMIPELWILWLRLENSNNGDENDKETYFEKQIKILGKNHFIFDSFAVVQTTVTRILADNESLIFQPIKSPVSLKILKAVEKTLGYPNGKKLMVPYEIYLPNPVKKSVIKSYEKALEFYKKVKDVESDIEKWFQLLIETNDNDFIINTIEYRLSIEPECAQLWKLYIGYLNDNIKCLDLYSRYCRLFIEDLETVKKYEKEIEKYSEKSINVSKWWFDIFEFQRQFYPSLYWLSMPNIIPNEIYQKLQEENFKQIFEKLKQEKLKKITLFSTEEIDLKKSKEIKKLFPLKPIQKQYFPFPSPFILYLLENCSLEICHKLYETCKYFFCKNNQKPICHNFMLTFFPNGSPKPTFTSQSVHLAINAFENHENFFNNYIISHQLTIASKGILHRNITSEILKKIELNIKRLFLANQYLTFEELQLLKSKKLGTIIFDNVIITNYKELSFSKIIETFLHISVLILQKYSISKNAITELTKLKTENKKIKRSMIFHEFQEYFEPELLLNFIKEICKPESYVNFRFSRNIPQNLRNVLINAFKEETLNFVE